MASYTRFRYIAYQVPTISINQRFLADIEPGDPPGPMDERVTGIIDTVTNNDAKERVGVFYQVLEKARQSVLEAQDDDRTLKIFMAPEFYFRPVVPDSTTQPQSPSYTYVEYREIKEALRALVTFPAYDHWLIIAGTIMWSGAGGFGKRPDTQGRNVFFNTALYIYRSKWFMWRKDQTRVIEKAGSSTIDGLPTGRHGSRDVVLNSYASGEVLRSYYSSEYKRQKHVFAINGVTIGLEICVEHNKRILKNMLSAPLCCWRPLMFRRSISLQLLTAGGMTINEDNVAAKNRGYVLRTDGSTRMATKVEMRKVLRYEREVISQNVVQFVNSDYAHADSTAQLDNADIAELEVGLANLQRPNPGVDGDWTAATFPQQLCVYRPRLLP